MNLTDGSIHAMLDSRARRLRPESVVEAARRIADTSNATLRSPIFQRIRLAGALAAAATVGMVILFVLIQPGLRTGPGAGSPRLFQPGIYQSSRALGGDGVAEHLCVAIALDDRYVRPTPVGAWWWSAAATDCRQAASGVVAQSFIVTPVELPSTGPLPARTAYLVSFEIQLLPAGTQAVTFTLDPAARTSQSDPVPARIGPSGSASVDFALVSALQVEVPGGSPLPTPQIAPAQTP